MELGAQGTCQLTAAEKQCQRNPGLCDYCADRGHRWADCPVRLDGTRPLANRNPPRFNRQAVMTFQVTKPETQSENVDTQE